MEEELEYSATHPEVFEKYKVAATITNEAMKRVVLECKPGAKIVEICAFGDKFILDEVAKVYSKSKEMEKGIAFPTCVSPNNIVGHFSPLSDDTTLLNEGDLVKIDLGTHIDGYIICAAHTIIVTATPDVPVTGKKADVVCAAHFAAEAALRLFRPGKKNADVTKAINTVADNFGCHVVEGVLSHQMKRFVIDGPNVVISKETVDHKVDEVIFQDYDVFCFDIVMSTGEGKPKENEAKTTIFKRTPDTQYSLRLAAARTTLSEITSRFSTMLFSLRNFKDEKRAKLGIKECINHGLVDPYPVLYEKEGEFVAQFKFTAILKSKETVKLTSHPLPFVQSQLSVTDKEINTILAMGLKRNTSKKGKKKKKKRNANAAPASTETTESTEKAPMDTGN